MSKVDRPKQPALKGLQTEGVEVRKGKDAVKAALDGRRSAEGKAVAAAEASLRWAQRDGEQVDPTDFHSVQYWARDARHDVAKVGAKLDQLSVGASRRHADDVKRLREEFGALVSQLNEKLREGFAPLDEISDQRWAELGDAVGSLRLAGTDSAYLPTDTVAGVLHKLATGQEVTVPPSGDVREYRTISSLDELVPLAAEREAQAAAKAAAQAELEASRRRDAVNACGGAEVHAELCAALDKVTRFGARFGRPVDEVLTSLARGDWVRAQVEGTYAVEAPEDDPEFFYRWHDAPVGRLVLKSVDDLRTISSALDEARAGEPNPDAAAAKECDTLVRAARELGVRFEHADPTAEAAAGRPTRFWLGGTVTTTAPPDSEWFSDHHAVSSSALNASSLSALRDALTVLLQ